MRFGICRYCCLVSIGVLGWLASEMVQSSATTPINIPLSVQTQEAHLSRRAPHWVVAPGISWPPRTHRGAAVLPLAIASDPALAEVYPYATLYGVEVMLGTMPMQLVVDTGASNSVISERIAETLQLPSTSVPRERIESFVVGEHCADQQLNLYRLPPITAGQAQVTGIAALGLPFRTNPTGTPGVLGMDFLSAFDVTLDGKSGELGLRSPTRPDPNAIQLTGQVGLMIADVSINSSGSFPFMLDTGAALTVLSQDLANQIDLDLSQAMPIDVIGFCGTEQGQYLRLSQVALDQHVVDELDVIILDNPLLSALNIDGILGQNFLSRYHQHWRFGEPDEQGFPASGSLELTPL